MYESYFQSVNKDQLTFDSAGTDSRTATFCKHVLESVELGIGAEVLDYGCGTGNVARSLRQARPDLRITGLDLSDDQWEKGYLRDVLDEFSVQKIPSGRKFDLIVMSHSLEHIVNPLGLLSDLASHLTSEGSLAIAVPNCETDPMKLVVADHCTHFSFSSLKCLLAAAGFGCKSLGQSDSDREIRVLARFGDLVKSELAESTWVSESIRRVVEASRRLSRLASASPQIGVFGTSIAGTWAFSERKAQVVAFIDEDMGRIDKKFHDVPVIHPSRVPDSLEVAIPPMGRDSGELVNRLSGRYPSVRWVSL